MLIDKCIADLINAIYNVDKHYLKIIGQNTEGKEYQQAAENAFTAELYHQYKSIIENDQTDYYKNLLVHYDLTKERFDFKRPDIVLHKAPNSRDDQRLYIEIKTNSITNAYDSDFDKIFKALEIDNGYDKLGFKNAVFISNNISIETGNSKIKGYINFKQLNDDERLNRIYYVHLNPHGLITIKLFEEIK